MAHFPDPSLLGHCVIHRLIRHTYRHKGLYYYGMDAILHVQVRTPYEAESAEAGGADRLVLVGSDPRLSPEIDLVPKVRKATSLDLRLQLRTQLEYTTSGAEITRLKGLASSFLSAGCDGFVFGFLNALSGIDQPACQELIGDDIWNWTFDRAIDATLDQTSAWEDIHFLPRLDSVMTAGSARQVEHGLDRLITYANRQPTVIVAGNLKPEHIPWLVRAGLRQFYLDQLPITTDTVRAWRNLLDEETSRSS